MQKFTTEAQRTQSFPWEMFLCDLCASVVRNLHEKSRKLFRTQSSMVKSELRRLKQTAENVFVNLPVCYGLADKLSH